MVKQYPHMIWFTTTTDATLDDNGDWISSAGESVLKVKCRAESSTGDGYLTGSDGKRIDYSWIVYLPLDTPLVKIGSNVSVYDGTDVLIDKDTVKRYSKGQLNVRVWL
jgi:hypothetical protein